MGARSLNKIKDFVKAEEVCSDIVAFVQEHMDDSDELPTFVKFAIKAHYMRAKNMLHTMEFRKAKEILDEEALPLLKALFDKYQKFEGDI